MITQQQLHLIYDWAHDTASKIVSEGEQCAPVLLQCRFIKDKLYAAVIGIRDFHTPEDKDRVAALIKQLMRKPDVNAVCFVNESWYVGPIDPEKATRADIEAGRDAFMNEILPSQHPDRKECVMFMIYTKLYDCCALCPIERPSNVLAKSELKFTAGTMTGRFVREPIK
jgi:hypothetical protein